jgi:uncharacterized protein (DUF488 family)
LNNAAKKSPERSVVKRRLNHVSLYTVGHSTRSLRDFISLLTANGIEQVVDVPTVPRSRKSPQFNKETLPERLKASHRRYKHLPQLGGLRHPQSGSLNAGLRNSSFRGFTDYLQTAGFKTAIESLFVIAQKKRATIMCAEALSWRCHGSLIGDALTHRNVKVHHVMSRTALRLHVITSLASFRGTQITYP